MSFSFRTSRPILAILALALATGCTSSRPKRTVNSEPPLIVGDASGSGGAIVAEAPQARAISAIDRHPLLSRPRDRYDSTNGNKLTRTAAAAVIGVPSGIGAEIRQIIVGQAPAR